MIYPKLQQPVILRQAVSSYSSSKQVHVPKRINRWVGWIVRQIVDQLPDLENIDTQGLAHQGDFIGEGDIHVPVCILYGFSHFCGKTADWYNRCF